MMDHLNNIHRENCVLRYSVQEFIEIKVWWLLTYTINWFLYILLSYIKGYRYFQIMIQLWFKFCFSLRTSFKELIWCTNDPMFVFIFSKSIRDLFKGAFSLLVSSIVEWNCYSLGFHNMNTENAPCYWSVLCWNTLRWKGM